MIKYSFIVFLLLVLLSFSSVPVFSLTEANLKGDIENVVDYSGNGYSIINRQNESRYTITLIGDGLAKIYFLFKLSNVSDQYYEFGYGDLKLEITVKDPQGSQDYSNREILLSNLDELILPVNGSMEFYVKILGDLGEISRAESDGPDDGEWQVIVTPLIYYNNVEIPLSQKPLYIQVYTSSQETSPEPGSSLPDFGIIIAIVAFLASIITIAEAIFKPIRKAFRRSRRMKE